METIRVLSKEVIQRVAQSSANMWGKMFGYEEVQVEEIEKGEYERFALFGKNYPANTVESRKYKN